MSYILKKTVII